MSVWVLVLVYQSFITKGVAMTTVSHFDTQEECQAAAKNIDGYDKKDCIQVKK